VLVLREGDRKVTADVRYCIECGNSVLAAARFCNVCGGAQPVDGSGEGEPTGPTRSEPAVESTRPASSLASPAGAAPPLDVGDPAAGHAAAASAADGRMPWTQPSTPPHTAPPPPKMPDLQEASAPGSAALPPPMPPPPMPPESVAPTRQWSPSSSLPPVQTATAVPEWQRSLPGPFKSIPLELLAVCGLMTLAGLLILWPVLNSLPATFKLLGLSGPFFALGLLFCMVWLMLGLFGLTCLLLAWRLALGDRVARGISYVLLGAIAATLLVGNAHDTQLTLVLLACLGAIGILWLSPNVRAFFLGAGAPDGSQPVPVVVARTLIAVWGGCLCFEGVLFLPLAALGATYVPVGLLMIALGVGAFIVNGRLATGDDTARWIASTGAVANLILLLILGRSDPAILIPLALVAGVTWNLWVPGDSQSFFGSAGRLSA
jgi:hypothetical protein